MRRVRVALAGLVLAAWAGSAFGGQRPAGFGAYLPEDLSRSDDGEYASSRVCKACHPREYRTWYESYHRTMTQWASEESVVPDWSGTDFGYQGRSYRLFRRDGTFYVDMPRPGTTGALPDERFEARVLMTTGSHQMQYYWIPVPWAEPGRFLEGAAEFRRVCEGCHDDEGDSPLRGASLEPSDLKEFVGTETSDEGPSHDALLAALDPVERRHLSRFLEQIQFPGRLMQFPFVYFIRDGEWLHDEETFLQPEQPFLLNEPYGKHWNGNCDDCHTTGPSYGWDADDELGQTSVAEIGIACEACHGPGRAHVERYRNPLRRYRAHFAGVSPDDIVNPAKLDAARSASVCARCHAELIEKESSSPEPRPGQRIEESAHVLRWRTAPYPEWLEAAIDDEPDLLRNSFWSDGTMRIAGRDYNALVESACFQRGELSCVSCHALHGDQPEDQLRPEARGDGVCLSCHSDYGEDLEAHTHHPPESEASRCYSCHMPYTTWGLLGSIRAHRVDSPNVSTSITTDRPNACNLCHLDRSLEDVAGWLYRWYGQPKPSVPEGWRKTAASIKWLLSGDAVERATLAWHMGYGPAKDASGDDWEAPFLAELLDDPYPAVRRRAFESLSGYEAARDVRYDFRAASFRRLRVAAKVQARWHPRGKDRPALLIRNGSLLFAEIAALKARRNDTPVLVAE